MFIVTLLTNPERPVLDRAAVESLRNAWGGGDAVWLDPGVAAEFPVEAMPENRWQVWQDFQGLGVDLVVQPAGGRRKKMLLADMDSTMIQQECIDELADEAGVGAYVADITKRAMNAELDFESALRERVGLLKGLPVSVIDQVIRDRITLMPGGPVLLATMRANGGHAALVSGGVTAFTGEIAARVGFDWPSTDEVVAKIAEEAAELVEARATLNDAEVVEEFGDLLFVMANLARHLNVDPEAALRAANAKFSRRFGRIEDWLAEAGKAPSDSDLAEMDALWNRAKAEGKAR